MNRTKVRKFVLLSILHLSLLALSSTLRAQETKKVTVNGSVQSDVLIPQGDADIGAPDYDEWALTNTYADVQLQSRYVDAGARFEFTQYPLPGYEKDFKGWGLPHLWVKGRLKTLELTAGTFYEQFGSGFILRTYEERSLGIDNALLGGRLLFKPFRGVTLKALTGRQRRYWHLNKAWVSGADAELNLDEWFPALGEHGTYLTMGGSFVNKHERAADDLIMVDPTHKLNLPEDVNAFDVRARFQKGGFNILAEYAQKSQDPSFDNGYAYRTGRVAMLSGSYSQRGMSVLLQAKRSDNMSFRSRRSQDGASSMINHLPAFTLDHTYALAALYPYATHPDGEWAYQAEIGYQFKRGTALGGKYGTTVRLNASHVRGISLAKQLANAQPKGGDGYHQKFFSQGDETYYQDINLQMDKRLTKDWRLTLMYMNQRYNQSIVEGHGGMINSNIFIADAKWRINSKFTLRGEGQYLLTADDKGDWAFGLLELSFLPHFMFTLSDMWNVGDTKTHYYMGSITFSHGAHRLQAGYGRTRAGMNCSGGVCRWVPATRGVTLSYNFNW